MPEQTRFEFVVTTHRDGYFVAQPAENASPSGFGPVDPAGIGDTKLEAIASLIKILSGNEARQSRGLHSVTTWRGEPIEVSAAAVQHLMDRLDAAWGYIRDLEDRAGIPHVENLIDRQDIDS